MKGLTIIAAAAMLSASFAGAALAQGMASKDDQIKTATSALPAALRDGATVISYDSKGLPQVLRQGNNNIFCVEQLHRRRLQCELPRQCVARRF